MCKHITLIRFRGTSYFPTSGIQITSAHSTVWCGRQNA